MNKIRIIDLLNKIANGEIEEGKKFNWHYKIKDVELTYMKRCGAIGLYFKDGINTITGEIRYTGLFERYNYQILNDEVEIIEEPKKIEKLSYQQIGSYLLEKNEKLAYTNEINKQINKLGTKINEMVDYINEAKNEK